jgi:four helix bundle protein
VNLNGTVDVIGTVDERAQPGPFMLSFQKLDVDQRSIDFLVLAHRVRHRMPKGHADLADQLRRSAQSCRRTSRRARAGPHAPTKPSTTRSRAGSAMESAAHLDVMRVDELIDPEHYTRGVELLERVVAILTKLIDP